MTGFLRGTGCLLLLCAGIGGGYAVPAHMKECQRQVSVFARLLDYLAEMLDAQALTGPELLQRAARSPDFAAFCPAGTLAGTLAGLALPEGLPDALQSEIQETLAAAEESPRLSACAALHRLAKHCEAEAAAQAERYSAARRLWPRLGACLGALTAILLW